ncbi:MAG: hypothetical protein ABIU77_06995, partial [Ferruginibacter sp.]
SSAEIVIETADSFIIFNHCWQPLPTLKFYKKMIRKIGGVIAGYAIFVASSLALFKLSGQDPHLQATTNFQILAAIYGATFSFLSGLVV